MQNAKLVKQFEKTSGLRVISKQLFGDFLAESSLLNKKITFYDFECPPRRIIYKNGKEFVDYQMNLDEIFSGKKNDAFTELPKSIAHQNLEFRVLNKLKKQRIDFRYIKIISDTNLLYITPESKNLIKSGKPFDEFKLKIDSVTQNYPVKCKVVLFSELMKNLRNEYDLAFKTAMVKLSSGGLIDQKTFNSQLSRTNKHVGINDDNFIKLFAKRTIATYAAEGIVFELLSKSDSFSNCVWLNLYEANRRTENITNCLRKQKGINKLPMLVR